MIEKLVKMDLESYEYLRNQADYYQIMEKDEKGIVFSIRNYSVKNIGLFKDLMAFTNDARIEEALALLKKENEEIVKNAEYKYKLYLEVVENPILSDVEKQSALNKEAISLLELRGSFSKRLLFLFGLF